MKLVSPGAGCVKGNTAKPHSRAPTQPLKSCHSEGLQARNIVVNKSS
jgi:hypothetical protein